MQVSESAVREAKRQLLSQLSDVQSTHHCMHDEQRRLQELLTDAMQHRVCRCVLLVGTKGSGKKMILNGAIANVLGPPEHSSSRYMLAAVDGASVPDNVQALDVLAAQLSVQASKGEIISNATLLEVFRLCKLESRPVIIVLHNIHVYTECSRQLLLYVLLDVMQRSDVQYILVGTTYKLDFRHKLDKRIISRLNSQYIFTRDPTCEEVIGSLLHRLRLRADGDATSSVTGAESTSRTVIPSDYRERFNEAVETMLRRDGGSLRLHIHRYTAWGRNMPYFLDLLSRIVSVYLSPSQPLLTDRVVQDYFALYAASSDRSLQSRIQDLSSLQLQILISIMITQRKMFTTGYTLGNCLDQYDRLTHNLRQRKITKMRVFQTVLELAELGFVQQAKETATSKLIDLQDCLHDNIQLSLRVPWEVMHGYVRSSALRLPESFRQAILLPDITT